MQKLVNEILIIFFPNNKLVIFSPNIILSSMLEINEIIAVVKNVLPTWAITNSLIVSVYSTLLIINLNGLNDTSITFK